MRLLGHFPSPGSVLLSSEGASPPFWAGYLGGLKAMGVKGLKFKHCVWVRRDVFPI